MKAALQDIRSYEVGAEEYHATISRRVSGGLMLRVDGVPLYRLGAAIGDLRTHLGAPNDPTIAMMEFALVQLFGALDFAVNQSILPEPTKTAGKTLLDLIQALFNEPDKSRPVLMLERGQFLYALIQFETTLANDVSRLDLYWIEPKLGYSTQILLTAAHRVFPESIQVALPQKVKDDIDRAGECLAFDLSTAVGFHVLRAVELVVLDYFTIPGWTCDAKTWVGYSRRLAHYKVHRKIRNMVDRLAELHRNELMHAEAVLSKEEAAILFALAQEVIPLMVADIAKRKGTPIADFPILNDPRWQ